jgi:hypothetical protein
MRIADGVTVMGGATTRPSAAAEPRRTETRVVMTIIPAFRYAGGFRVYGRGAHAAVSLANDGATVGALRRWRTASLGERIETRISAEQVRAQIERQLAPQVRQRGTRATVDEIEVAYYDGNADNMQPVCYFEATVESAEKRISDIKTAGYLCAVLRDCSKRASNLSAFSPSLSLEPPQQISSTSSPRSDLRVRKTSPRKLCTPSASAFHAGVDVDNIFPYAGTQQPFLLGQRGCCECIEVSLENRLKFLIGHGRVLLRCGPFEPSHKHHGRRPPVPRSMAEGPSRASQVLQKLGSARPRTMSSGPIPGTVSCAPNPPLLH